MKNTYILLLMVLTFTIHGQNGSKNLHAELARLKTETALIVQSQAIDEYPLWAPKSDFIACNIEGKWFKVKLTQIDLAEATWRGQTIGVLTTKDAYTALTPQERQTFENVSKWNPREVRTKTGTMVELKMEGMSVSLIITPKGGKAWKVWTSGGENCHSLVLSPDQQYVAYLCELTGLMVMKLP